MTDDLATLPEEARAALESAMACTDPSSPEAVEHTRRSMAAVGFPASDPQHPVYPLPSSLTGAQRALVTIACARDLRTLGYACPVIQRPSGAGLGTRTSTDLLGRCLRPRCRRCHALQEEVFGHLEEGRGHERGNRPPETERVGASATRAAPGH
jgi:hypothetical protein